MIESLVKRIKKNNLKEVIIATSATVEGQTTAHYIEDTIKNEKPKITKLAQGLPVGGEIEQLDDGIYFQLLKKSSSYWQLILGFFLKSFCEAKVLYNQTVELDL